MPSEEIYSKLSIIYNTVMHKVRYDRWSEYLLAVVELYMNDQAEVLEIAGGNCNFAGYFVEYFPNLIVTDKSFNMLASSEFKDISRVCCDMTKLPFKSKFDLIYSTFDSVNYLTSKRSLLHLFKGVKAVLKEDGIFTFDVSLERNSLLHVENPVRKGICSGISFVHKTSYNQKMRIHKNIFKINIDNDIFTEVHKQKIYPFELYFDLIEQAGMYVVECMETFSFIKASADSERVQFIVKK
ncbi:MAG: class I SAM-dependent methyltransferase [Ignavibacteriaceae bacterium]